ncbi:alpha/beta hydrolase [Rhodobacteraceae bacterium N5(2021)]|uniref:Alpha/beta hydrolase n=1 Tax=Gymnodinialimonas phycosphaerae TaxID=2841589 RepID=A0A975TXW7_9RHOB|nr:alpha/beta hydrolase [Gymnodinialimonas phycosphaerae]MBY4892516.1 alpha/beta hydrolase [Gymnodinialimonas phycosphaerae]
MSVLTNLDRVFTLYARILEKPTLWAVSSQKLMRFLFAATAPMWHRLPRGCRLQKDPDGTLHITPQGAETAGLFFYIHGGGFTLGSPTTNRAVAAHIVHAAGLRAYCVRYPLAPEHPFPAAPDAVFGAYSALVEAGTVPVAIGGDSAGGNLALLTMQRARDAGLPLPKAMVLMAPVADLSDDLEARFAQAASEYLIPAVWAKRIERAYLRDTDPASPAVSPLLGDLRGLPPTLIHTAEGEALSQDAKALAARMDDATLDIWPGLPHVWHLKAGVAPAATQACAELGAFIKAHA